MLQPDFHIHSAKSEDEDMTKCRLLLEVNHNAFSYVLLNLRGMKPLVLKYFQLATYKERTLAESLREIIYEDEWLTASTDETFLVYNFPESNLVPDKLFNIETSRSMTDLMYGNLNKELVLSEKIPWWDIHNVYRIPADVHSLLQQKFTAGRYWHFYSLQLKSHKMFNAREEEQYLKAVFYADKMVVFILRDGQLLIAQTFAYQDAKDVVYHLLNCCQQLHLNPDIVLVQASGLVERKSSLYDEINKYFLRVSFEGLSDNIRVTDELKEFPLHYFSSLLKMAVCV